VVRTDWLVSRRELISGFALGAAALPDAGVAAAAPAAALVDGAQFGLAGDGVTPNDAHFAVAFGALAAQSGGVLRLAPGTYQFAKPLTVPAGTVIEGAGMGVTVLRCTAEITGVTFASGHSRCGLRALSLEGTGKKGTGLQIGDRDFTGNHHVRDVLIRSWAVGCRLAGALWTTFDNVTIDENARGLDFNAGWSSGYSTTVAFRQCVFSANDYGGVTASNTPIMSSSISWLGCTIERNCRADPTRYPQMAFASGDYGISGFLIDGCYFEAGGKPAPDAIHANGLRCGRISNCNFYDSAYAIRDAAGGNAEAARQFIARELFGPLGLEQATLEFDSAGTPLGTIQVWASARDWARFGLLYLHDGVSTTGERILPKGWVDYSARLTPQSDAYGYGAGFWTQRGNSTAGRERIGSGMPADSFMARGNQGQYTIIIPSEDLVIVRLGWSYTADDDIAAVERLTREIIAALPE